MHDMYKIIRRKNLCFLYLICLFFCLLYGGKLNEGKNENYCVLQFFKPLVNNNPNILYGSHRYNI